MASLFDSNIYSALMYFIIFFPQMPNLNMLQNFVQPENKYINLVNLFVALCIQFPQLTSAHLPFFPIVI